MYRQISNISRTKAQTLILFPFHLAAVFAQPIEVKY